MRKNNEKSRSGTARPRRRTIPRSELCGARAPRRRYVEYGADGRVIKGAPVAARQSRYAEDVHRVGP